ncbi:polysaccharide biosynthesis protein CapD [Rhodobacter ferrooxidans]|uniref:Polysaccharide biosynthesis protein CapD n=2 Tax=Rhodobacter ferrooxidans TaxID=371731 RepID=C8S2U1_9RHOB|nr:polysaccharide biosynthesis protein CapD [Rhodobacter sp. SW2]
MSRPRKRLVQVSADVFLLTMSFFLAMLLRLETYGFLRAPEVWLLLALVLVPSILLFIVLGFYRAVIRYIGFQALRIVAAGVLASAVLLFVMAQFIGYPISRSVPVIYAALAFLSVGGVRFVMRALNARSEMVSKKPVIIYGAGQSGRQLLVSLKQGPEYAAVALIDDNPDVQGGVIEGCRVFGPQALPGLVKKYDVRTMLLAIPSASQAERKRILERLEPLPVHVQTIPGIRDIVSGQAKISELREVAIEDLLGRDPVPVRPELLGANIRGKVVMITGAGGSIGSELCRQIIRVGPRCVVLFELSEFALYAIDQELRQIAKDEKLDLRIMPVLGSVQDQAAVCAVLTAFGVQTVYHAAAYKHVPMVEFNVLEGIRNNVFGSLTMAQAAVAAGVESFLLVSTDKAVRPTNVMGATKRLAELVCQALARQQTHTRFCMVRFGNVLGSSGSVIPLFHSQISKGGPITVTHPEITRFFMTIPEAAQLVLQAGAMAQGGDVFVLDMGQPVRIVDLAKRMARLSGLTPVLAEDGAGDTAAGTIRITFTKLREGEKLYEELLIGTDARPTAHPRIMTATEIAMDWDNLAPVLEQLRAACDSRSVAAVRQILLHTPIDYTPSEGLNDLVWNEAHLADALTDIAAQ